MKKKLLDAAACCALAGAFGWFIAHEYERWHPRKVEVRIVYVDRQEVAPVKNIKVVEGGNNGKKAR